MAPQTPTLPPHPPRAQIEPHDLEDLLRHAKSLRDKVLVALWAETRATPQRLVSLNLGHVHFLPGQGTAEVHLPTPLGLLRRGGVTFEPQTEKWRARVGDARRRVYLGRFSSPEEARRAVEQYQNARFPPRPVLVRRSVPYLLALCNRHPLAPRPEAPLFLRLDAVPDDVEAESDGGGPHADAEWLRLSVRQAQKIARRALHRAGLACPLA